MNWDNTTRLDLWRNLRRYFPKATLTCCFSAIRMLSLLSFSSPVSSSFQNAMLCLAQPGQHVFTLRWTVWFAGNSTSSDEYGLTTAANCRLIRHRFFAVLFARLVNYSRIKPNKGLCDCRICMRQRKNEQYSSCILENIFVCRNILRHRKGINKIRPQEPCDSNGWNWF